MWQELLAQLEKAKAKSKGPKPEGSSLAAPQSGGVPGGGGYSKEDLLAQLKRLEGDK